MNDNKKLEQEIKEDTDRIQKAEKEKFTLLSQTVYLGSLGLMLVLPIIAGAYLGHWLDRNTQGFSFSWTISLIVTGVLIGALNVYFFLRSTE